jgi:amino-acid N-acetyltransferase
MSLPAGCQLRPAQATDLGAIRWLIIRAMLDPTQVRWQQFWVVVHANQVIACGQLRRYGLAQELGSLVVQPSWRGQGIGTGLTRHLIHQAEGRLYLECLGNGRAEFYARFGFAEADWGAMPAEIAAKFRLSRTLSRVLPIPLHMLEHRQSHAN